MLKSIKMTECAIPFSPLLLCFPHISCYGLIKGLCLHRVKTNTDIKYFTANGVFYPHSCLQEYSLTGRLGFYLYTVCMYVYIYIMCVYCIYIYISYMLQNLTWNPKIALAIFQNKLSGSLLEV